MAGAKYGLFTGLLFVAAFFAGPAAKAGVMLAVALQLAISTIIVWRRTRLPYMTLAGLLGIAGSTTAAVVFYRELDVLTWSLPVALFYTTAVAGPILLLIESRVHRDEWIRWREHMENMSLVDLLLARHIPRLRDEHQH